MPLDTLTEHWALLCGAALLLGVLVFAAATLRRASAGGKLSRARREVKRTRRAARRARQRTDAARRTLGRLEARSGRVAPRRMDEARDALADAEALQKIADDKVLIAANHVRKIIVEEYPPDRQERLRRKYLGNGAPEKRPFSF